VKDIFDQVRALPEGRRADSLDEACAEDHELRQEVESLLSSYETSADFLEQPAATVFASLSAAGPLEGLTIGPYRVGSRVGAGGMGEVYKALDTRLGRSVAMKVLPAHLATDPMVRERFEREARAVAALNHPHICTLYDVGAQDGINFLVMEFLEGETLAAMLTRGPVPLPKALEYATQIASALDKAHRAGIVHRDLKPGNVMVTPGGAKLLDFGLAKPRATGVEAGAVVTRELTGPGTILGTAQYMAPEQIEGRDADARSDLFGFGAVLHEMLTGKKAFDAPTNAQLAAAILASYPPRVSELEPEVPAALDTIVGRCLAKDPDARWQTAHDLLAELERFRAGFYLSGVHRVSDGSHVGRGSWDGARKKTQVRLAAAAALVVGIALSAYLLARVRGAPPPTPTALRSVAVLPFKPLGPATQGDEYVGIGLSDALITELSAFGTLAVPPLSATSRYGANRDPIAAGRELGTELVLDGAIQRSADRLRINVSLLRVADGSMIWGDQFDVAWSDVFRVEDTIAERVGRALAAASSGEGRARVLRRRTENVAAYEAYLKGRYFWSMRTIDALQRALVYFQQAIELDRKYAPAYAGLSDTYQMLGSMPYAVMPASEAASKAKAAAHKALEIDDTLAEAHASLGFVTYAFDWQWADGERAFRRAIELDPSYATAHIWYAGYLGLIGRVDEGIVEAERARVLDPLSLIGTYSVGLAHYLARHYSAAEEFARKSLEIDANFPSGRRLLGEVYAAQGRHAEALTEFKRLNDTSRGNWLHMALLAQAYGRTNERAKAREILAGMIEASKTRFVPPAQIAIGYIGLDDRDAAFMWLERARAEHSQVLTFVKMDPMFDSLRSDPRYAELIRNIGLNP
jgi:serine/threonine-protein kinase